MERTRGGLFRRLMRFMMKALSGPPLGAPMGGPMGDPMRGPVDGPMGDPMRGPIGEMKFDFNGTVRGDEISGQVQFGSLGSGTFKGTRS